MDGCGHCSQGGGGGLGCSQGDCAEAEAEAKAEKVEDEAEAALFQETHSTAKPKAVAKDAAKANTEEEAAAPMELQDVVTTVPEGHAHVRQVDIQRRTMRGAGRMNCTGKDWPRTSALIPILQQQNHQRACRRHYLQPIPRETTGW